MFINQFELYVVVSCVKPLERVWKMQGISLAASLTDIFPHLQLLVLIVVEDKRR